MSLRTKSGYVLWRSKIEWGKTCISKGVIKYFWIIRISVYLMHIISLQILLLRYRPNWWNTTEISSRRHRRKNNSFFIAKWNQSIWFNIKERVLFVSLQKQKEPKWLHCDSHWITVLHQTRLRSYWKVRWIDVVIKIWQMDEESWAFAS